MPELVARRAVSMNQFSSSAIRSPSPGVRSARKNGTAGAGYSAQLMGRTNASSSTTPRTRPGWRAARSRASEPPQS